MGEVRKSSSEDIRVYVLMEIQPGKEGDFANDLLSKGLILDSKVERLDFVHGYFDFIVALKGKLVDIDRLIIELRKSPFILKTQTLICFEMFNWDWDEIKAKLNEEKN
ncbi:MAG: hypothetical protein JW815_00305 [Candidatus Bathyarchaeota archaeon]|nr:hypothetical protein [Candidatus Bathyarchaeum sp.]